MVGHFLALTWVNRDSWVYGKEQLVRLRNVVAMARFLKGKLVRAVWCEFYDADKQRWSKARLLLATETDLRAKEILHPYARRWGIEPLFHNLKRWWGVDTGSVIESGCGRSFSYRCRGAVARQTTTDRRSDGAVATHGIYRTCFQGQFEPEVLDIHLPRTTRRPRIAGVAAPSAASKAVSFASFLVCVTVWVTQGWGWMSKVEFSFKEPCKIMFFFSIPF